MAKFKGAKWARLLTLMAAIAVSVVSEVASAKSYADGQIQAIAAGDVAFSSSNFTSENVGGALEELFTAVGSVNSNSAVCISTQRQRLACCAATLSLRVEAPSERSLLLLPLRLQPILVSNRYCWRRECLKWHSTSH